VTKRLLKTLEKQQAHWAVKF